MANWTVRLTVCEPRLIEILGGLKSSRKQSIFLLEALRFYLATSEGQHSLTLHTVRGTSPDVEKGAAQVKLPVPSESTRAQQSFGSRSISSNKIDLDEMFRR
jgi:hypothetical protein